MKPYLSFFLIPYLLAFINCNYTNYTLVIDGTSFGFTLEENDAANEFKAKFPLKINMLNIIDEDNDVYLGYVEDDFWTKSLERMIMLPNIMDI